MTFTASMLERIALCPGAPFLEEGLIEVVSDIGESGRYLHRKLAEYWNGIPGVLVEKQSSDDALIAAFIREATQWIEKYTDGRKHRRFVEQRIECGDGYSGQPDLVVTWEYLNNKFALILDWKSGWIEQEPSPTNLQLRAYAVLVGLAHKCSTVFVALLQRNTRTILTQYNPADLLKARAEIIEIIKKATPGAPRHAGEIQCRYCRAIGICPEAIASIQNVLDVAEEASDMSLAGPLGKDSAMLVARCLTGLQLAHIHRHKRIAELVFEAIDEEIRKRLQDDPSSIPGWMLKPGNRRRTIRDAGAAFELLSGDLDGKAFAECCAVRIGDLEERFQKATGATAAQAKQALSERLAPVIEETQNQPSIVRQP